MLKKSVQTILNGLSVAVFVIDAKQIIRFGNIAAQERFGIDAVEDDLLSVIPAKECQKAAERVLKNDETTVSLELTLQDVVPTTFRMIVTRLDAELTGKKARAIISLEDISHIREAEQMRIDFVANVSHELRSPLTSLSGFIETLQGAAKDDPIARERFLDLMLNDAQRMSRLIGDLLSLSKLQASERVAPQETVNLDTILRRVVASLEPISNTEETSIVLFVSDNLPMVVGDADELTQVFQNLIENGIKYSKRGTEVIITAEADPSHDNQLRISVRDHGEGIDPQHIPRLTERFYRIDKGRSRDMGGTGLGLAIVKHILIRHRAYLHIDSNLGLGSIFSVFLPVAETE
ncbi:histidine kinase [Amylibacter sp. SFDW26]|uniref:ATP-binding protein n=1 Tax=Amylibacter sp. SFDW26 TaxID=2652722 RepID=UPI0012616E87|nr:ATP-binding protein [Amylibacter sp. SFDW26]KAB7616104.1 histidine kinase [Amylibacter sp. SFDW26]